MEVLSLLWPLASSTAITEATLSTAGNYLQASLLSLAAAELSATLSSSSATLRYLCGLLSHLNFDGLTSFSLLSVGSKLLSQ